MENSEEKLIKLMSLVTRMRSCQKDYYKTKRDSPDKQKILIASKIAEKEVDGYLLALTQESEATA